jgi:lipopolysaccharide/colanic/teichoic acid biosynthesis glycosyltransferase
MNDRTDSAAATAISEHDLYSHSGLVRTIDYAGWLIVANRVRDVVVSALAIVFLAPVLLVIAALIKLDSPGPVIFAQRRGGRFGMPFLCFKFRTMTVLEDGMQVVQAKKNDQRVTRVGRFLRKTSLDELPQILNILRGEMTLVGPRPVTAAELAEHYGPAIRYYTAARPGLTGLWQVSGRSEVDYARRVALDTLYVKRWSMLLDLSIALRTPVAVLASRGSY